MSCHLCVSLVHCATPIYSAVLLILHDLFCTFFATEGGPFWGRSILPSETVYHVSYAQEPTSTYKMPMELRMLWTCTNVHRSSWISNKLSSQCTSTSLEAWTISGQRQWHTRDWYIRETVDQESRLGSMAYVGPEVGLGHYSVFSCYLFSPSCDVTSSQICTLTTHSLTMYFMVNAIHNGIQHLSMIYQ